MVATAALFAPATAHADRTITLTFVRHAESEANAAGVIDTALPGPRLSDTGYQQAGAAAAAALGYAPRFSFEEGLRLTLEWYKARQPR